VFDSSIGYDFGKRFGNLIGLSTRLSVNNLFDKAMSPAFPTISVTTVTSAW
jgi:hypothetical protein